MREHDSHSSFIKTPRQLIVVVLLAFVVPVIGIVMLVQLVVNRPHADPATMSPEAVAARIRPVGRIELAAPSGGDARVAKTGEEVVKSVCAACHDTGAAGAPKIGDAAAWKKLLPAGLDLLTRRAVEGIRAMPPRGGSPDLTELEIRRAIVYMGNRSGGNLRESAEPPARTKK